MKKLDIARQIKKIQIKNGTYVSSIGAYRMTELRTKKELIEQLEDLKSGKTQY
jgi:hypothetical protein